MPHVKSLAIFFGAREIGRVSLSGHGTFLSRRSYAAAKTEVPTQSGLLLPYEWLFIQLTAHRKRNPACGWTKSGPWPVEILSSFGRNLCAAHTNDEAPCLGVAAEQRRRMAAIYSRSLHSRRRPRRSCAAAKTGRGTCRPTRRPTAVRAAGQTAQRFAL